MAEVISRTDLENGKVDLDDLADVVNGSATLNGTGTVTTRLGGSVRTLAKAVQEVAGRFTAGGPVEVVATTSITLSGTQTIDGVAIGVGDRVLCVGQSSGPANGIYVAASGAWARASDMNAVDEFFGAIVTVRSGTLGAGSAWYCLTRVTAVGTTAVTFVSAFELDGLVATKADATALAAVETAVDRLGRNALELSPNLFNVADPDYADNFFVNGTDGELQANSDFEATGFIPVTAGQSYYLPVRRWLAWYNAAKTYISGSDPNTGAGTVTAPANAAFGRFSIPNAARWTNANFYVVEGTEALDPYQAYGSVVVGSKLIGVGTDALENGAVTPAKTSFLTPSKNLFDKDAATLDIFMGANGTPTASTTYAVSDFIEVEPGETYFGRSATQEMRFWTAFDAAKNVVPSSGSNAQGTSFTVPAAGVKFYRVTVWKSELATFQLEKGTSQTGYADFGFSFTDDVKVQSEAASPNWAGAITYSFGDSITAQAMWQPGVVSNFGLVHTAFGVGGRRVSGASGMCQDAAIDAMPTGADLILVLGGTNDWAQSVQLDTVGSSDVNTFNGAYNQMCQKLTTRFPTARILLLTTPYGELPGRLTDGSGWPSASTNNQGLTTRDYAEAVRNMGKRWGMPVVDLSQCGWNSVNVDAFMKDDGGHIHPNEAGGARMSEVIRGVMRALEPLEAI